MQIIFLGSGTSTGLPAIGCECEVCKSDNPKDKRQRSSLLIRTNKVANIIIDTGPDFRQQCLTTELKEIAGVLYTHAHMDHIAGLDDLRRFNCMMKDILNVYASGPVLEHLQRVFGYAFAEEYHTPMLPALVPNQVKHSIPFSLAGVEFTPLQISHGEEEATAYIFNKIAYVTDCSDMDAEVRDRLKGIDTLILGALRHRPHFKHYSFEQAIAVIEDLKPGRAFLTHLGHDCRHADQARIIKSGNISFAYDGLEIEI